MRIKGFWVMEYVNNTSMINTRFDMFLLKDQTWFNGGVVLRANFSTFIDQ